MLTTAGACIRPSSNWRSHEYRKLRELHDKVKTVTNIETNQDQHDGPYSGRASPHTDLLGLEELILDLRCCTSTLMDLVPVIEHTKDVLAKYVFRQRVSRSQQMRTYVPPASSVQNKNVGVVARGETEEPSQKISGRESQKSFSDALSTVPPIQTADNAARIETTNQKIVLPKSRKPSSVATDNTLPKLEKARPNVSGEALYGSVLQKSSSQFSISKPTRIAAENVCGGNGEGDAGEQKKIGDESGQSGVLSDSEGKIEESTHQIDQTDPSQPGLNNRRQPTPLSNAERPAKAVDISTEGLATRFLGPHEIETSLEKLVPSAWLPSFCAICNIPSDSCVHSLTTTYGAPAFDTYLEHSEHPSYQNSASLNSLPRDSSSQEGNHSLFLGYEDYLRQQTIVQPATVQAHVESIYTPGDRITVCETRTKLTSHRRQPPRLDGYPCTVEGCAKTFSRACELKYVAPHHYSFEKQQSPTKLIFPSRHRKIHLDRSERPHKCSVCDEGFLYPKDLHRHQRKHTTSIQSTALYCHYPSCTNLEGFSRRDNLLRHQRKHYL
jgi:hypothetical protein